MWASSQPAAATPLVQAQACQPQQQFLVTVPQGMAPGQPLQVNSPDGQLLQVNVPAGLQAGQTFPCAYTPAATVVAMPPPGQAQMMAPPVVGQYAMPACAPMQQGMNPMMQPGGGALNYLPSLMSGAVPDAFAILGQVESVRIKQQMQLAEVLVGFDMPNKYIISNALTGHDLFVAAERSDGIMGVVGRQVFAGGQRPFNLDIALLLPGAPPIPFIRVERPFKCTCCCFQRPEMHIYNAATNQLLASTVEPCSCCHFRLGIRDHEMNDILHINHHCCDCSIMCWGCPCGCQETNFEVKDGGRAVGNIRREFNTAQALGMVTGVNVDSDQFSVDFREVQQTEWKAVLIATAIFLDYCYFTKGGQQARDESAMGRMMQIASDN
jgi:hypothetical protein